MSAFHEEVLHQAEPIWRAMRAHPFLAETAAGTISRDVFARWMQQDYLFVREAVPFLAILLARAPATLRRPLGEALAALHRELEVFERLAREHHVALEGIRMLPTCHAYVHFLLATAYGRSFPEAFTVLYAAEKAYLDAWSWVKQQQRATSPWQAFIENWTSSTFCEYVEWLGHTLDGLAYGVPDSLRAAMRELFLTTAQYELRFWDMAWRGEQWPVDMS
jgi:thiaminase